MASQVQLTTKLIEQRLAKWAARQPSRVRYDSAGGRDSSTTTGIVIGSTTQIDASYCILSTEVTYEPPVAEE